MNVPWRMLRRILLWTLLVFLVILAGLGLMFFDRLVPRRHPVTVSFAGWTNDTTAGRIAVLTISNRSRKPVTYFADRDRRPRCDLMVLASSEKHGHTVYIRYTNLIDRVWIGHLPLQLQPESSVDCLLPWHDEFTNGPITFSYMPEPNFLQRTYEKVSLVLFRQAGTPLLSVPLRGAPWTNAPGEAWQR